MNPTRDIARANAVLRAGTILLALVFTLPACFTMTTWRDNRSSEVVAEVATPALRAFLACDPPLRHGAGPTRLVLQVPESLRAELQAAAPAWSPATAWVEIEPLEHPDTVVAVLAVQSATLDDRATLDVVAEPGERSPTLRLRCRTWSRLSVGAPLDELGRSLPGFRFDWTPGYQLDVPCRLLPHAGDVTAASALELRAFAVRHVRCHDDGRPFVSRVLLTPFALAGDVLLSPFELLWWLSL